MTTHDLKCWPRFFDAVAGGTKDFELRRDDRPFAAGDVLRLREWDPDLRGGAYTGHEVTRRVSYVLREPAWIPGYVVLGLFPLLAHIDGQREALDLLEPFLREEGRATLEAARRDLARREAEATGLLS